jgi:hypothetical protein
LLLAAACVLPGGPGTDACVCGVSDNNIGDAGVAAILGAMRLNFTLRYAGLDDDENFDAELACHYRVPRVRWLVRTRVMCQAGRARAAAGARRNINAWLCERAPLWVVVHVCALLDEDGGLYLMDGR